MKWETAKLGDYIDILSGYAFKSRDFVDNGIPVIKIKNITPPNVSLDDLSFVSDETAEKAHKYLLNYNDVLIALTGSHINQMASVVGRVARVKYNQPSLLNQRVGKIIANDNSKCDIDYVYYYLSQDDIKIKLATKAGGAANQANISPSDVKALDIPFPEYDTQKMISSILLSYDALVENNQKQIKLLEEAAQRLYKEWFVDLRFPGHETTPIVEGVPEGWKHGKLYEIAEFKRGKTITKSQAITGIIPVVSGGLEPAYYHNESNTTSPVITVSGSGANAGFTRLYYTNVFASDCSFLDCNSSKYLYFIYCFLQNNKEELNSLRKGSAQPHVYAKDINAMRLNIPNNHIMELFCKRIGELYEKVKILTMQIQNLQEARDRLLPKLMNGKIEV